MPSTPAAPGRKALILQIGVFRRYRAFVAHAWWVTRNWTAGFMSGHEFRQAQTAITTYYIDQHNNFSLLYETPILGKPWVSILMEVPFYEWTVVGVSRWAHVPHYVAARTVSLACFYLTLPAIYLLLGPAGPAAAAPPAGAGAGPGLPGLHLLLARLPDGFDGADVLQRLVPLRLRADDGPAAVAVVSPGFVRRHRGRARQKRHSGDLALAGGRVCGLAALVRCADARRLGGVLRDDLLGNGRCGGSAGRAATGGSS